MREIKFRAWDGNYKKMIEGEDAGELTSNQMRDRANSKRDMANTIKMNGGGVKPEYE